MRAASTVLATALILAIGGCLHSPSQDPMTDEMAEIEEGRIDFSRTTSFDGDKLTVFVRDSEDGKLHLNRSCPGPWCKRLALYAASGG